MRDPIARYISDLEDSLRPKLGAYQAHLIAHEAEAHLRERADAYIELGADDEVAQREAIEVFGAPREISARFNEPRKSWLLPGWACEVLVLLGWSTLLLYVVFPSWPWLNLVELLLVSVPCLFCRRFPIFGFLVGMSAATGLEIWHVVHSDRNFWESWPTVAVMLTGLMLGPFMIGELTRRCLVRWRTRIAG